MQDARDSKKRKNENAPQPSHETRGNHRENAARGTHPPRRRKTQQKQRGRRKTQQGEPNPPREKEKKTTRPRTNRKESTKYLGGCHALRKAGSSDVDPLQRELELAESSWEGAVPPPQSSRKKLAKITKTQLQLPLLSSCSCRQKNKSL